MTYPTAIEIRRVMLKRANEYMRLVNRTRLAHQQEGLSSISKKALNDGSFLPECATGMRNFTIDNYRRVMAWLDDNWPRAGEDGNGATKKKSRKKKLAPKKARSARKIKRLQPTA